MITVHASKSPFSDQWVEAQVPAHQTIEEITGGAPVIAWVDGHEVPRHLMSKVRFKDDVEIVMRPVPEDDSEIRVVLQIVVAVVATIYAPQIASEAWSQALASAAIIYAGNLAINELVPPPQPEQRDDTGGGFNRLNALTGASNQIAAYQPIPRLYGRMRYFPPLPMTAPPYTELRGQEQFLRMYLVLGYGPLYIGGKEVGKNRSKVNRTTEDSIDAYTANSDWNGGSFTRTESQNGNVIISDPDNDSSGLWEDAIPTNNNNRALTTRISWTSDSGHLNVGTVNNSVNEGSVSFETSVDGGNTWQAVGDGEPIPGISRGVDLSTIDLRVRATITRTVVTRTRRGQSDKFYYSARLKALKIEIESGTNAFGNDAPVTVGGTNIDDFDEVEYEIGRPDQMTLYTDEILQSNPAFSTDSGDDGTSAIRTTDTGATEISLDITGRLFCTNDSGKTRKSEVKFTVEYREKGTNTWSSPINFVISSSKRETVRQGKRFSVCDPSDDTTDCSSKQWEVRLTRIDTNHTSSTQQFDTLTWNTLRTIRGGARSPFAVDDMVVMDLKIKATDQLNGRIDDLSILATSILPVWNGSSWVEEATRTPAWIVADIFTGSANRRPIAKSSLDTAALLDWAQRTNNSGTYNETPGNYSSDSEYFDQVFDDSGVTVERADKVASIGRARWYVSSDTTISIAQDIPQSDPQMVVSARNAWAHNYQMAAVEIPHAVRVRYINQQTWENDERIVYDDGYSENGDSSTTEATKFETLEAPGVTQPEQAWRFGRYHLAQQQLRPSRYSFKQDVQHMRYRPGDLIVYQQDVILVGIKSGRVKSITTDSNGDVVSFTSDEFLDMPDSNEDYGVKIQRDDGTIAVVGVANENPGTTDVDLDTPTSDIDVDDLFIFGISGKENVDVKVTTIESEEELQVRTTCVPAAPNILDSFSGAIPTHNPVLTQPINPDNVDLPTPSIDNIESDESVLIADGDGGLRIRMLVETSVDGFPGWDESRQLRYRETGAANWNLLEESKKDAFSVFDVDSEVKYEVQVRSVRGPKTSNWSGSTYHTVVGKTTPPPDVEGLEATVVNKNDGNANSYAIHVSWFDVLVPDLDRYEVRPNDANWGLVDGELLARPKDNFVDLPITKAGTFTYYVKAWDTANPKNQSTNATSVSITINAPNAPNNLSATTTNKLDGNSKSYGIRLTWDENPTQFPIVKNNVYDGSGNLIDTVSGGESSLPITTAGSYTFEVESVDAPGNAGARASVSITIQTPGQPTLTQRFSSDEFVLSWTEDIRDFPIAYYDVRRQHGSETGDLTIEGSTNTIKADQNAANPVDLSDFDNSYSTKIVLSGFSKSGNNGTLDITSVSITNNLHEITVSQSLTDESASATVDHVNSFAEAQRIDTLQSRELKFIADWLGKRTWYVAEIDVAGNQGAAGSVDATINSAPKPKSLSSKVIDLSVLLNWNEVKGTLPIEQYNVYRDDDQNASFGDTTNELSTTVKGTFASLQEDTEGTFAYFVVAQDTAGNEGAVASLTATSSEPNDFVVQSDFSTDFTSGTRTNLVLQEPGVNVLLGPFDTTETWEDHFIGTGTQSSPQFPTPQDQIDAGYPYYLQPGRKTSGSYQEEFDTGAVLDTTTISVSYGLTQIAGNPTASTQIEVRESTSDSWRVFQGETLLANNVRYIRVTVTVDGPNKDDLAELKNLNVKAKTKKITEEGTVTIRADDNDTSVISGGATKITLNNTFLDIRAADGTARGKIDGSDDGYDSVIVEVTWADVQDQNEIHAVAFDRATGNRVDQDISYLVRGIVN